MNNQPYKGGGIVGAKPHYTGGQGRHGQPAYKSSVTIEQALERFDHLQMANASGAFSGLSSALAISMGVETLKTYQKRMEEAYYRYEKSPAFLTIDSPGGMSGNAGFQRPGYYEEARISHLFGVDPAFLSFKALYFQQPNRMESQVAPQRISAAQIHAELYQAADTLLVAPVASTQTKPVPSDRVRTLIDMGFHQQADVQVFQEEDRRYEIQALEYSNKLDEHKRAFSYQLKFPNYKFITHQALTKVMEKYWLICRETRLFIGTIPDRNVADMAQFQQVLQTSKYRGLISQKFCIAAPTDQFVRHVSFLGQTMTEAEYQKWLVEDPILLAPLTDNSGFLIVTAWGDEAADPEVINERNN